MGSGGPDVWTAPPSCSGLAVLLTYQERLEFLARTSLFGQASPAALQELVRIARQHECPAGNVIVGEGEPGDSIFLMVEGELEVVKADIPVRNLGESGTCFGEMAFLDRGPRSATIRTTRPSRLLEFHRDDLYPLMVEDFSLAWCLFRELNRRVRRDLEERVHAVREECARVEAMRLAAEVQQALVPREEICHPRLATAGYCRPAGAVGGDFYDYLSLPGDRFAIFIADVMGHGVHSALLAAMTRSGLRVQARFDASVAAVMGAISQIVQQDLRTWIYLTCCYAVLDLPGHRLHFANAAHPSILLQQAATGRVVELKPQYMPLGFESESHMTGDEAECLPGDVLLFYSDGIPSAQGPTGDVYGLDRLKDVLRRTAACRAEDIRAAVLEDLSAHCGPFAQEDDVTLVVARWL